jgi:hypothetical protein
MKPIEKYLDYLPLKWRDKATKIIESENVFDDLVSINFEDGSHLTFFHATMILEQVAEYRYEAIVLTEHCGYHQFDLSMDDVFFSASMSKTIIDEDLKD